MRFKMVDRHQRFFVDQRDRLGSRQPDDHAADQPGPGGCGNAVEIGEAAFRLGHSLRDHRIERLDMGARGNLGHHPAERGMLADL